MSSPRCPVPSLPWAAPLLRHRVKGQLRSSQGLVNNRAGDKSHSKEEQRQCLKAVMHSKMLIRFLLPEQRLLSITFASAEPSCVPALSLNEGGKGGKKRSCVFEASNHKVGYCILFSLLHWVDFERCQSRFIITRS